MFVVHIGRSQLPSFSSSFSSISKGLTRGPDLVPSVSKVTDSGIRGLGATNFIRSSPLKDAVAVVGLLNVLRDVLAMASHGGVRRKYPCGSLLASPNLLRCPSQDVASQDVYSPKPSLAHVSPLSWPSIRSLPVALVLPE